LAVKAVIFDHNTLIVPVENGELLGQLRKLVLGLKSLGLAIVVFSTHPYDIHGELVRRGLPAPDLFLTKEDVKKNKGSPVWIQVASQRLDLKPWEFFYVGSDEWDWRTAINAGVLSIYAAWSRQPHGRMTTVRVDQPAEVEIFVTHFLLPPLRWSYSLYIEDHGVLVRCLLGALVYLPCSDPGTQFRLQEVFTYGTQISIGAYRARDALMFHAISSLYLEGLIPPGAFFAVYPSSQVGQISPTLREFLEPAAKLFHGYFKKDLLIRSKTAPDMSMERAKARRERRSADLPFSTQTNTVNVNPDYDGKVQGRTIIVFDDFTTTGMSLEWARNLLYAARASRVILLTIGKYPGPYTLYVPRRAATVKPFDSARYNTDRLFESQPLKMKHDPKVEVLIRAAFDYMRQGKPMPQSDPL
jgi:hypothetical protein